jgi:hypothetical protein
LNLIKLLLLAILFTGCTHTTVNVILPQESINMEHTSGMRRGCYKLAGQIDGKASASMVAQDRSASRDLTAIATVAAAAVSGPVAAGVTALGGAVDQYFDGDKDSDQNCKFEK